MTEKTKSAFDDTIKTIGEVADTAGNIAGLITAIVKAAEVPPEVKISHENRRRAKRIGILAGEVSATLAKIVGPVDTHREILWQSKIDKWTAELKAMGVTV